MEESQGILGRCLVPDGFARQSQRATVFDQRTPANWYFRRTKQLVRQNEKEEVGAAILHQLLEFCSIAQLILQCAQFAQDPRVVAMTNCTEIMRVPFQQRAIRPGAGQGNERADVFR